MVRSHTPESLDPRSAHLPPEEMVKTFAECGYPVFRCSSPLCRGVLKNKGGGRSSKHFNADPSTVIAVDRLNIYGAVAKWCNHYEVVHVFKTHIS